MQSLQSATAIIAAVLHENCESENLRKLARLDTERGECLLKGIDWSGYELHAACWRYPRNDLITTMLPAPPSEQAAAKEPGTEKAEETAAEQPAAQAFAAPEPAAKADKDMPLKKAGKHLCLDYHCYTLH